MKCAQHRLAKVFRRKFRRSYRKAPWCRDVWQWGAKVAFNGFVLKAFPIDDIIQYTCRSGFTKASPSVSPDHCRYCEVSDPKKEEFRECCTHSHLIECDRCQELQNLFDSLDETIGNVINSSKISDEIADLLFLINDSKDKIELWKSHILRSVNQDEGKNDVYSSYQEVWPWKSLSIFFTTAFKTQWL